MSILGVDPGLGVTGFALLDDGPSGQLVFRKSGEIRTHPKTPFPERLKQIFDHILSEIDSEAPSALAIEDTFLSRNFKSAMKLGQARAAAVLAAACRNRPVFEYTPTSVKMSVVGYGGATKMQVQRMVARILQLTRPLTSEHEADAAAVAICHIHSACCPSQTPLPLQAVSGTGRK
ncbi:MAG: crossover junction endodeoxyribonuclease RuvC [Nitrospiria bacterium]